MWHGERQTSLEDEWLQMHIHSLMLTRASTIVANTARIVVAAVSGCTSSCTGVSNEHRNSNSSNHSTVACWLQ